MDAFEEAERALRKQEDSRAMSPMISMRNVHVERDLKEFRESAKTCFITKSTMTIPSDPILEAKSIYISRQDREKYGFNFSYESKY